MSIDVMELAQATGAYCVSDEMNQVDTTLTERQLEAFANAIATQAIEDFKASLVPVARIGELNEYKCFELLNIRGYEMRSVLYALPTKEADK